MNVRVTSVLLPLECTLRVQSTQILIYKTLSTCVETLSIEASIAFLEVPHTQQDQSHVFDDMRTETSRVFLQMLL